MPFCVSCMPGCLSPQFSVVVVTKLRNKIDFPTHTFQIAPIIYDFVSIDKRLSIHLCPCLWLIFNCTQDNAPHARLIKMDSWDVRFNQKLVLSFRLLSFCFVCVVCRQLFIFTVRIRLILTWLFLSVVYDAAIRFVFFFFVFSSY